MTNEAPEQRDGDVRHLDQQPGGLARCASRTVTRSVATSKKLTVSELVTNAGQHATRSVPPDRLELTLRHSHVQLLIEVAAPDTRPPVRADVVSSMSECGRGLQLVESVSKEWGYYRRPAGGKVVWCALAVNAQQFS
ncbi:ATP-binding protein [Streptomyces californicus]|uniref:ATP-binding protein n=1 Tax=Streptomyces californicus TaxID=67351 RepID=UPI0034D95CED